MSEQPSPAYVQPRVIRVFVSSTFRDMQAERDHLVRFVFPRLREQLFPCRLYLVDVDLRWGVTSDQDVSEVCREIIDECRPYFLCILGGRYGWVPPGKTHSITADEVHYGVLDRPLNDRGFPHFYFRDEVATAAMTETTPGKFREPRGSDNQNKLSELKQDIVAAGLNPFTYPAQWDNNSRRLTDLKEFGDRVYDDLLASIKSDPELRDRFVTDTAEQIDEFAEENAAMEAFVAERSERFVLGSRKTVLEELLAYASATVGDGYICLIGAPGSGKSALLAHFSQYSIPSSQPSTLLIRHFVGASPRSTDVQHTLRRLCHELRAGCSDITADIPDDPEKLRLAFPDFLQQACTRQRVVILLDAVNQFDRGSYSAGLHWLPEDLPVNARIILSALDGPALEELRHRRRPPREIELQPLTAADGAAIIEQFRRRYHKRFEPGQRATLLAKADAGTPLYLLAALEELRTLGTCEEITRRIAELPPTTHELFAWILKRLENDDGFRDAAGRRVGRELVSRFAALLGASRRGLSQRELADLLDAGDPQGNVAALLRLLRPYLMRRDELLDFYHGQLRGAAGTRYLSEKTESIEAHKTIADYFETRWREPDEHALAELPWQQAYAELWDPLKATLSNLDFVDGKIKAVGVWDTIGDYSYVPDEDTSERAQVCRAMLDMLKLRAAWLATSPEFFLSEVATELVCLMEGDTAKELTREALARLDASGRPHLRRLAGPAAALSGRLTGQPIDVSVSQDGRFLAVVDDTCRISLVEVDTRRLLWSRNLPGQPHRVWFSEWEAPVIHAIGTRGICVFSTEGVIRFKYGDEQLSEEHRGVGRVCPLSRDEVATVDTWRARSAGSLEEMKPWWLWDLRRGSFRTIEERGFPSEPWQPPQPTRRAQVIENQIVIWEAGAAGEVVGRLGSPTQRVRNVWFASRPLLALASDGELINLWTQEVVSRFPDDGREIVAASALRHALGWMALLSDGEVWLIGSEENVPYIRLTFDQLRKLQDIAVSPCNRYLYACIGSHYGGTMLKYDLWEQKTVWQTRADGDVITLAALDQTYVVCGNIIAHRGHVFFESGTVRVHRSEDGGVTAEDIHGQGINAASYREDLELVYLARLNGELDVRRIEDLAPVAQLRADAQDCMHVAAHPSLPLVATAGTEGMVRIWDVNAQRVVFEKPFGTHLVGLAFSQDGDALMVATPELATRAYSLQQFGLPEPTTDFLTGPLPDAQVVLDRLDLSDPAGVCPRIDQVIAWNQQAQWHRSARGAARLLRDEPDDAEVWASLGGSLSNVRFFEGAAEALRMAIHLNRRDWASWANLGLALYEIGRAEEAARCLDEYITRCPGNERAEHLRRKIEQEIIWEQSAGARPKTDRPIPLHTAKAEPRVKRAPVAARQPAQRQAGRKIEPERWAALEASLTDLRYVRAMFAAGLHVRLLNQYDAVRAGRVALAPPVRTPHLWDGSLGVWCPFCLAWSALLSEALGTIHPCPACANPIRINPFVMEARWPIGSLVRREPPAPPPGKGFRPSAALAEFADFYRSQAHFLSKHPRQIYQQARNQPESSAPARAARRLEPSLSMPWWIRWVNKPPGGDACLAILEGGPKDDLSHSFPGACSYSPDGQRILAAGPDRRLRIWDAQTCEQVLTIEGFKWSVGFATYSPDGLSILSASGSIFDGGVLDLWDAGTGDRIATYRGHSNAIGGCWFSPDGRRIVSICWMENESLVWDAKSGGKILKLAGHWERVEACSFRPDGRQVVTASADGTLRIWVAKNGAEVAVLKGHSDEVNACAWSPDGRHIVSGSDDHTLCVWDAESGKRVAVLKGHTSGVDACWYSPSGTHLLSSSSRENILWDAQSHQNLGQIRCEGKLYGFSPDGGRILSSTPKLTLKVWDWRALIEPPGPPPPAHDVCCYSPDGKSVLTRSHSSGLQIWRAEDGAQAAALTGHAGEVNAYAWSPDGRRIVSGSDDGTVRLWDVSKGRAVHRLSVGDLRVKSCSFTPDGQRIVAGGGDYRKIGKLWVWDPETGREVLSCQVDEDYLHACACDPDGRRVLCMLNGPLLKILDLHTGSELVTLEGHSERARTSAWSPDGQCVVSGEESGDQASRLRVWDAQTGEHLGTLLGHSQAIIHCGYSPDGQAILSISRDDTLRIWSAQTFAQIASIPGYVWSDRCSFSPDGQTVLAHTHEGSLMIFSARTGSLRAVFGGPSFDASAGFDPTGHAVAVGNLQGGVSVLHLEGFNVGPPVVTPVHLFWHDTQDWEVTPSVQCPWCGHRGVPSGYVLDVIADITRTAGLASDDAPCVHLPEEAWDEPRLVSECLHCRKPLRFNPFIVDNRERY